MKPGTRVRCRFGLDGNGTVVQDSAIPGCALVCFDRAGGTRYTVTRRIHRTSLTPLCHCTTCRPGEPQ